MKRLTILLAAIYLFSFATFANCDVIILTNGIQKISKILEVNDSYVKYQNCDDATSAIQIIEKKDIGELQYANKKEKKVKKILSILKDYPRKQNGYNFFKYKKDKKVKFYAAAAGLGGRIGMMSKFGFHLTVTTDLWEEDFAYLAGISKSIIRKKNFQWNAALIGGLSEAYIGYTTSESGTRYNGITGNYDYYTDYTTKYRYENLLAYGVGTEVAVGHLYLSADAYVDTESYLHLLVGVGYVF